MARIVVIVSLLLAACEVGELPNLAGDSGAMDDGMGSGSDCVDLSQNIPSGHHNPGMGCMSAGGCHNQALGLGVGAPAWSFAGTLYTDTAGTTPFPGATIVVKIGDAQAQVVTADNGNFMIAPGAGGLEPLEAGQLGDTWATACPTTLPMVSKLVVGGGNCNSCHTPGGTATPIYLTPPL